MFSDVGTVGKVKVIGGDGEFIDGVFIEKEK